MAFKTNNNMQNIPKINQPTAVSLNFKRPPEQMFRVWWQLLERNTSQYNTVMTNHLPFVNKILNVGQSMYLCVRNMNKIQAWCSVHVTDNLSNNMIIFMIAKKKKSTSRITALWEGATTLHFARISQNSHEIRDFGP